MKSLGERIRFISEYSYYVPKVVKEADIDLTGETPVDADTEDMGAEPNMDAAPEEGTGNKIQVNMTDLVVKQQEAIDQLTQTLNQWVADINNNIGEVKQSVMSTKAETEKSLNGMMAEVDAELKKRIPTPNEKLQMQSLSAYPYNIKLTDYFIPVKADKPQNVNISQDGLGRNYFDKISDQSEQIAKDYVLTTDDIENSYNQVDVENSF
jgi:hypothetical protein